MTTTVQFLDTPDGPFGLLEDDAGRVIAAGWTDDVAALLGRIRADARPTEEPVPAERPTASAQAVHRYYAGDPSAVAEIPVRQFGTEGQQSGWAGLRRIRPGRPLTYAQFAAALGSPRAVRAAAGVCARNAVALFVPCHRVLRTDGGVGGFAWGEEVKRSLLAREAELG